MRCAFVIDTREGGREGGGISVDKTHCYSGEYLAMKEETITLGSGKEASSISGIKRPFILHAEIGDHISMIGSDLVVLVWDLRLHSPLQHCMHEGRLHVKC